MNTFIPNFSGKLKLITSSQLLGFMESLPANCKAGQPWTIEQGVRHAQNAGTSDAADCLIIGGQTRRLKNLYHIKPKDIDPQKTAQNIGKELNDLSQTSGEGLHLLITGGDFGFPERHNTYIHSKASMARSNSRGEVGRSFFDALVEMIEKMGFAKDLKVMAGRTTGNSGHTGVVMREGDTDWYLNVIRGCNLRVTQGVLSPEAVKRMFEEIKL